MLERTIRPRHAIDLALTLGPLCRGRRDPTMRVGASGIWRATRTPEGPVATHLRSSGNEIAVRAWGPGSAWALAAAPVLVGATDDDRDFRPLHPKVAELHRRLPGLRISRSNAVVEALVPTIIEQKVQGTAAKRSYRALVCTWGEPAPGPAGDAGLLLPPSPRFLADAPSYAFHPFGLERKRADAIRRACSYAHRLEETTTMAVADARLRLCALPGVGPWSAAEIAMVALGDADAVSIGDYHLPHDVSWALAGEARGTDERMLELLEPFAGHRGRVIRLLMAAGIRAPRYGPRLPLQRIADV